MNPSKRLTSLEWFIGAIFLLLESWPIFSESSLWTPLRTLIWMMGLWLLVIALFLIFSRNEEENDAPHH